MRPKILCFTSHDLGGPTHGAILRAKNIFRTLQNIGEVNVVLAGAFGRTAETDGAGEPFPFIETVKFHRRRGFAPLEFLRREFDPRFLHTENQQASLPDRERILTLCAQQDLIWFHGLRAANGLGVFRWSRSVLDVDDIPSSLARCRLVTEKNILKKFRHWWQQESWKRRENILQERFNAICVCSEADRAQLGHERIFVVPNGFAATGKNLPRQPVEPRRVGFVGNFAYPPNREGMEWFLACVWPRILAAAPATRLRIAGALSEKAEWRKFRNVELLGWIPEVEPEMASWSLAVVPIFVGGGTRVKIVEAFSFHCPVVSTRLGAFGYDVEDDRELLLADDPTQFAAKCLELLKNSETGRRLADNARAKFLANWTWDVVTARVEKVAETVLTQNK